MVALSLERYSALTGEIELRLDEADKVSALDPVRHDEKEVFSRVKSLIHDREAL